MRTEARIHPGLKAILISCVWALTGIIFGLLTYLSISPGQSNLSIVLTTLLGFIAIISGLGSLAWLVLSYQSLFSLIYLTFGFAVLIIALFLSAGACTALVVMICIDAFMKHEPHFHAIIGLTVACGVLWSFFLHLLIAWVKARRNS